MQEKPAFFVSEEANGFSAPEEAGLVVGASGTTEERVGFHPWLHLGIIPGSFCFCFKHFAAELPPAR